MSQFNINNLCARNVQINGKDVKVNGRDIVPEECRRVEERKTISAIDIKRISICTKRADINIVEADSYVIDIRLYGRTREQNQISFLNVTASKNKLEINLDEYEMSNLALEVKLPKKLFQKVEVTSRQGDIFICEGITTNKLNMQTMSGDIDAKCTFTHLLAIASSGDINIATIAEKDIANACIQSKSGDIVVQFENVGNMELTMQTMSGDAKNYRTAKGGKYSANVNLNTISGDIVCK